MTIPQPAPAGNNTLLIIIGATIVVLLAIIATAVSSQAIRAGQEADAKASVVARVSASAQAVVDAQKAIDDAAAQRLTDAEEACHDAVQMQRSTPVFKSTASVMYGFDGYETDGIYTDKALYGNEIPMQHVRRTRESKSGSGWTSTVTALGRQ
ncbi:hypothetical protein J3A64_001732 [Pseudarthrobacter sp. PvP004]|uniref:hypothetical protein n=1 Tax=Pseudarthrobacter sp. PvP004 TaxID=2817850 RepID=UPI001AE9AA94|nr:hypothetical protein [Pseudarthrobacter sp. PvP004]MBP2266268.1 hypothetical protein [Pseudarthrobacter sp. PvP004]